MDLDTLDQLAAEKVMGWYFDDDEDCPSTPIYVGRNVFGLTHEKCSVEDWQPTRNIAQAWELLEKLGKPFLVAKSVLGDFGITINPPILTEEEAADFILAETAPLAITKACLKAVGENID